MMRWRRARGRRATLMPILVIGLALGATGCDAFAIPQVRPARHPTVRFAVDLPPSQRNGALLALKAARDAHYSSIESLDIQLVILNAAGPADPDPVAARDEFKRRVLGDPLVLGEVGPYNATIARKEIGLAQQQSLAVISPGITDECLTQGQPYCPSGEPGKFRPHNSGPTRAGDLDFFRLCPPRTIEGTPAADLAFDSMGKRSAYVVDDKTPYGVVLASAFDRRFQTKGGSVLAHDSVDPAAGIRAEAAQVASRRPDVVYFGTADPALAAAFRRETGNLGIPLVVGGAVRSGTAYAAAAGSAGEGTIASLPAPDLAAGAPDFLKAYRAAFPADTEVDPYSLFAYDAMSMLISNLRKLQSEVSDASILPVRQSFRGGMVGLRYDDPFTNAGANAFDANGDNANLNISFYTMTKGRWVYLDSLPAGG